MDAVHQIRLNLLMNKSSGRSNITVGLIDGPIDFSHIDLQNIKIKTIEKVCNDTCRNVKSFACIHGTFVAGILSAKRGSLAPSICPSCRLVTRPIFTEGQPRKPLQPILSDKNINNINKNLDFLPTNNLEELSNAIIEIVNAGANIINLSLGLSTSSIIDCHRLQDAYDYARKHESIVVVAAGNQGNIGNTSLINHPWVIPVSACDVNGVIATISNYGPSIGKKGLMAPGINITSTFAGGGYTTLNGTSFAAPFVTGTIALLWSLFPDLSAAKIIQSVIMTNERHHHRSIIPSLLNAEHAFNTLKENK